MDYRISNACVLVTGGAGFIGSNLCETLLAQGNQVRCLDNFSTGSRQNVAHLLPHPHFTLIEADIRDLAACRAAAQGADYVLHQAALGSVPRSIKDPGPTNEVNVSGFLNILMAAQEARVERLVYASSSSVYGDHPGSPKLEEYTGNLLSPYAVSKYSNELYAGVFGRLHGLPCIGLRYFNVFGRRQSPEGEYAAVIPRFVRALLRGESPAIYGDGLQARDFTYIDNVLQANQRAATVAQPEAIGQVYNVACGQSTTLNGLFEALAKALMPYKPEVAQVRPQYVPPRPGDIRFSLADIGKAARLLGYAPTHSMEQGLQEAIAWYWENLRENA